MLLKPCNDIFVASCYSKITSSLFANRWTNQLSSESELLKLAAYSESFINS